MALSAITEEGTLFWSCPGPKCKYNQSNPANRSYTPLTCKIDEVEIVDDQHARLPACPVCGSRMLVRVAFDEDELKNPNSVIYGYVDEEKVLPHAITGEPIPVRIPAFQPVGANPGLARHQELAKLLEKHGMRQKEKNQ